MLDQDKIIAAGKSGEVAIPTDTEVVDLAGKTIIPGLIDSHLLNFQIYTIQQRDFSYVKNLT